MTERPVLPLLLALASIAGCSVKRPPPARASEPAASLAVSGSRPESGEPRLDGKTLVRGRVSDQDDKPVADHEIWLVDMTMGSMIRARPGYLCEEDLKERVAKTRTDAEGRFEFEGVGTGKWWVGVAPVSGDRASPGRGDIAPLAVRFRLMEEEEKGGEREEEGEEEVEGTADRELTVDVKTYRGLELRGKVVLPDGKPAAACEVSALIDRMFTFAKVKTDERGAFAITALAPGDVWLQASREGLLADSEFTPVRAGKTDVVLTLTPAGAISGSIVDRGTREAVPATLFVTQRGGDRGCIQRSGSASEFQLDRLEPGVYDLAAISADGRIGVARGIAVRSDAHERGVAIEIAPGARLTFKYERTDAGASFRLFSQEACLGWLSLQSGQIAMQIVPPGPIRIVEMRAEGGIDRVVDAEAGQEQTVLLGTK